VLRVSKLGPRPEGGESGGPISNLSAQHSSPIFHKLIRLRARISKGQRMVGYTITEKWWWKKLLEEIKWELISAHPETAVSSDSDQEIHHAPPESCGRD